ncbi:MAG: DUF3575 domain-containing protein [Bacteroidales bacterium]|nr:DUF3575 domain-containing protein [Bacteroidales bacterium]
MAACAALAFSLIFGLSASAGVVRETVKSDVTDSVRISFPVGNAVLDENYGGNAEAFSVLNRILHPDTDLEFSLTGVKFVGGSSPEGTAEMNGELSEKRAKAVYDYFSANYGQFSSVPTSYTYVGRDWTGLLQLVKADSAVPSHEAAVELLEGIVAKDKADENDLAQLKYFAQSKPYYYMYEHIFPKLRGTTVYVTYDLVKVTEEPEPVVEPEPQPAPEPVVEPEPQPEPVAAKERKPFYMDISTNMLYDLAMTPNLGIEFYLGSSWSIAADWQYSWWNNDSHNFYWRNYGGDLTLRKWLGKKSKEKPLQGHHLGLYGQMFTYDYQTGGLGHVAGKYVYDDFNIGTNEQPWNWGVGIEYGYSLPVAKRLNIDFSIGVGYAGGHTNTYEPDSGHEYVTEAKRVSYIGPTRAEISLIWLIGYGNKNAGKGKN